MKHPSQRIMRSNLGLVSIGIIFFSILYALHNRIFHLCYINVSRCLPQKILIFFHCSLSFYPILYRYQTFYVFIKIQLKYFFYILIEVLFSFPFFVVILFSFIFVNRLTGYLSNN